MKFIKKSWKFVLSLILIIFLGLYVFVFAFKSVLNFNIYTKPSIETKIYSVWHIETFEGGGKSRLTYLKNLAAKIEKENKGVLFNISQIQPQKLESLLQINKPNIISFGFGVGKILLPYLTVQDNTYNVRDNLIDSGNFANKLYAIPYIIGGYAHFSHNQANRQTIYGNNDFTHPQNTENCIVYPSQYEAYKEFVNNKKINLIGTSRDLFRVNNLNDIGRLSATITPIEDYTDLVQYVASTKNDDITKLFISSLLTAEYQAKLTDYHLFSTLNTKIYSTGIYNDMENAILKSSSPNAF